MTALKILAGLLPLFCGLMGALIANVPVSVLGGVVPPPLLALIPVYFWCLVRPDLMTPAATFFIGLAEDILSGGPPGVWTLAFVLTYALIGRQRDSFAGLSGWGAVLGFAAATAFCCATAYITTAIYFWHWPQLAPILAELAMTVLFYVPGVYVVGGLHRRLVGPLRTDF